MNHIEDENKKLTDALANISLICQDNTAPAHELLTQIKKKAQELLYRNTVSAMVSKETCVVLETMAARIRTSRISDVTEPAVCVTRPRTVLIDGEVEHSVEVVETFFTEEGARKYADTEADDEELSIHVVPTCHNPEWKAVRELLSCLYVKERAT